MDKNRQMPIGGVSGHGEVYYPLLGVLLARLRAPFLARIARLALKTAIGLAILGAAQAIAADPPAPATEQLDIRDGLTVERVAGDDLATNIYSMTLDDLGRIIVSGPGYIRRLEDTDGDGKADRSVELFTGPADGAQGLYAEGDTLHFVGDGGWWQLFHPDQEGRFQSRKKLIAFKTGGEHDLHAIRRGPDRWWYLIAGNYAGIDARFLKGDRSPITKPRAGVLIRISPDLKQRQIMAHGFRNPYDFDFQLDGSIVVYDSDGERDISLPWYRPTRLFRALPGSDAGFVRRSWKRPDHFFDMMPVLARLGRGSPTGVEVYRHTAFPPRFRGATFVADWTRGRIMAVGPGGSGAPPKPWKLAEGREDFGFAPTDLAVGPDGSLYVAVGGRGTQGGVFRIRAESPARREPTEPASSEPLPSVRDADHPLHRAWVLRRGGASLRAWRAVLSDSDETVLRVGLESAMLSPAEVDDLEDIVPLVARCLGASSRDV
ncbi:MAG TPA: hypothetical protein ENJ50_04840, partial [Planctomycetaceae bacterium]|nr:hypothetical protein [Planctomycetaceae bacterium]